MELFKWALNTPLDKDKEGEGEGGEDKGNQTFIPSLHKAKGKVYHGDCLQVLPEIKKDYLEKVKLIYIDPPYNTKTNNFLSYEDSRSTGNWKDFITNSLIEAKQFLTPEGVIAVSMNDEELGTLRVSMDEVFGRSNFISTAVWERASSPFAKNGKGLGRVHDYIIFYAKNKNTMRPFKRQNRNDESIKNRYQNPDDDPRGLYIALPLSTRFPSNNPNYYYTIILPSGEEIKPYPCRRWCLSKDQYQNYLKNNRLIFSKKPKAPPKIKHFLNDTQPPPYTTLWLLEDVGLNQAATNELSSILGKRGAFTFNKPESLIERIVDITTESGELVLDYFGGSGTTGAVCQKMGRDWILVEQDKETIDEVIKPRLDYILKGHECPLTKKYLYLGGSDIQYVF